MAAITDLTWQQILDKLPPDSIVLTGGKVMIDVGKAMGVSANNIANLGAIRFTSVWLEAALQAQITVNVGQAVGEKLAAFPNPTGGPVVNGFAPVTRSFVSRSQLSTATKIIGQVV